jgi:amino acid transporter
MKKQITVVVFILAFLTLLLYKLRKKEKVELPDLVKCGLTAAPVPNLLAYLFYLMTDPEKVVTLPNFGLYVSVAIFTYLYVIGASLPKLFKSEKS